MTQPWVAPGGWSLALAFCLCAGLGALALAGLDWLQSRTDRDRPVIRQTVSLAPGSGRAVIQDGPVTLTLALTPQPVRLTQDHRAVVTVLAGGRPLPDARVTLRLRMPSQPAIDLTVALQDRGDGHYAGQVVLPLCTREPSRWLAEVRVDRTYGAIGGGFRFDVAP